MGKNPSKELGDADCKNRFRATLLTSWGSPGFRRGRARAPQVISKRQRYYSVPDLTHDVKVSANVVPRRQRSKQDLPGKEQVAKVGPGVPGTSIAIAALVQGPRVVLIARVLDDHPALGGEQAAVAGVARGQ